MKKIAVILCLICFSAIGMAQEKIYTKKMKLADFCEKTTKVVIPDNQAGKALQEEISMRWVFSPFEFCDEKTYQTQKTSTEYYFIRLEPRDGFLMLELSKGGKEKDTDHLQEGFVALSFAVSPAEGPYTDATHYMAAYVDILQRFITDACESERVAVFGLKTYAKSPGGKRQILIGDEAAEAFAQSRENAVASIQVAPSNPTEDSYVWNYLIGTDQSHYPYRISKNKWKKP